MARLPPLESEGGGVTTGSWAERRREIRRLVATRDPQGFLAWDAVVTSMTVGDLRTVVPELRALRAAPAWRAYWRPAVREDLVGCATPFLLYPASSGTLLHHAFHLLQFEQATGRRVTDVGRIVELGGGYGSMARLVDRLGFRGAYHLHDLPELSLLQQFFLQSVWATRPARDLSLTFSSRLADARTVLAATPPALFIATWSLSETPLTTREQWRPLLDRCGSFLLGYQGRFEGIDNATWFREYAATRPDVAWSHRPIAHRPGNAYWMGVPRTCASV